MSTESSSRPSADSTCHGVPRATKTPVPGSSSCFSPPTAASRAALEDVEHLVALVVAVLVACPVEAEQALPELGHGEERRDRSIGLLRVHAVLHEASLYRCAPLPLPVNAE